VIDDRFASLIAVDLCFLHRASDASNPARQRFSTGSFICLLSNVDIAPQAF
jgi:hypothetical protein